MNQQILVFLFLLVAIVLIIFGGTIYAHTFTHCPLCGGWASVNKSRTSNATYIVCRNCDTTSTTTDESVDK